MSMPGAYRGQKRVSDPLELELQEVVSHLIWMLGIELRSYGRAVSALNLSHLSNPPTLHP